MKMLILILEPTSFQNALPLEYNNNFLMFLCHVKFQGLRYNFMSTEPFKTARIFTCAHIKNASTKKGDVCIFPMMEEEKASVPCRKILQNLLL